MLNLDRENVEKILCVLDEKGYLFPEFQLNKENEQLHLLGRGGFSTVYEMIDKNRTQNRYALKVIGLERHLVTLDEFWNTVGLQRCIGEQSSNVMRILDARTLLITFDEDGEINGISDDVDERWSKAGLHLQFILMEKLEDIITKDKFGKATLLREELQNEGEVLKFAIQIGQALLVAHSNKVLHRDIKIENIFWDATEESYKLGDFGIAKLVEDGNAETVVYTDGYGAPEIKCRLSSFYDVTADIYSLGITLYLLLNGLKFPGSDGYTMNQVQYHPEFVFPAPENASENMTRVIRKMCNYRREERYQSMAEVLMDLRCVGEQDSSLEMDDYLAGIDLVTQTYQEEKKESTRQNNEEKKWETRADRKLEQMHKNAMYNRGSIWYFILLTVLFTLFLTNMQTDTTMITSWQFWLFPLVMLVEAVLQRVKEFHKFFGMVTLGFGVYAISTIGFTLPHVVMMICVIFGIPILTASGAVAVGCWMILTAMDRLEFLSFVYNHDVGWIILIILFVALAGLSKLRVRCGKVEEDLDYLSSFCILSSLFMALAGIVLAVLQLFDLVHLPEVIDKIHCFRTGFLLYWILVFMLHTDEDEMYEDTESVSE